MRSLLDGYLILVYTFMAMACTALGQIHLITGSPTPKYNQSFGSSLFRVDDDGSVILIQELVPETAGTDWISISYQARKAVLATLRETVVVDFDSPATVKRCRLPVVPNMSTIYQWIADIPSSGAYYLQFLAGDTDRILRGMNLSGAVLCEASFSDRPPEDTRFITLHGRSGVADTGTLDSMSVWISSDGGLKGKLDRGVEIPLPNSVSPGFAERYKSTRNTMLINDREVYVIAANILDPVTKEPAKTELVACLKINGRCQSVPVPGDSALWTRGFGKYLAITELRTRKQGQPNEEKSVGEGEWRKVAGRMGPSVMARLKDENLPWAFPGRLHLFNTETGEIHTIQTRQGDSEVLLVDGETVFYRASNRLYKAQITDRGVTNTRLLAQTEIIRDVHWAFMSR